MEKKFEYTAEENLAINIESTLYLVEKAEALCTSLYTVASLLDGKQDLDSVNIAGLKNMLLALQESFDGEITEHGESIEFLKAYKNSEIMKAKARYHR